MKNILAIMVLGLAPLHALHAQIPGKGDATPRQTAQIRPAQSPELTEADELSKQAVKFYKEDKFDKALPLAKRVLQIREGILPANDTRIFAAVNNLAFILMAKEKYGEAKVMFTRSLALMEAKFGQDDLQLVNVLTQLALAHHKQDEYEKAELFLSRALELREKKYGLNNATTLESLYLLADLHQAQQKFAKAETLLLRAIAAKEQATGDARIGLQTARGRYLALLTLDKRKTEAEALLAKMTSDATDPAQPKIGGVLNGRAIVTVAPAYPIEAKQIRAQGQVKVQVVIDQFGKVITATAVEGRRELLVASEQAARKWRFSPTLLSGRPVEVTGTIIFNFTLQ